MTNIDEVKDADYWKAQAEYWQGRANELEADIKAITSPEIIRFRGVDDDVMWQRDLYKMPSRCWDKAVQHQPHIEHWHQVESGSMLLALSPASSVTYLDDVEDDELDADEFGDDEGFGEDD